jgi:hypothetical protein
MPNHTSINLKISGEIADVKKFVETVNHGKVDENKEGKFDFSTIVPIPKDLVGTQAPASILTQEELDKEWDKYNKSSKKDKEERDKIWGKPTKYSFGMTKEQSDKLTKKYGFNDWYSWQVHNWGTKWNAYEIGAWSVGFEGAEINFCTAWSPPIAFLVNASKKFPDLTFEIKYSDEGGAFVGKTILTEGETQEELEPDWYSLEGMALREDLGSYSEGCDYEIEGRLEYLKQNPQDARENEVKNLKKELKNFKNNK